MNPYLLTILIISQLAFSACVSMDKYKTQFSYTDILDKDYRLGPGRTVPLTIEQSIQTEGDISRDGRYLYYSSNREKGNFDLYLRDLSDITTVRLTDHPAMESSPAISPDAKSLAFVSRRDDAEGDIFTASLDPEDIIRRVKSPLGIYQAIDSKSDNLTQAIDEKTKVVKSYRDASPAWSPDSRFIAFSSNRDGMENIWVMKANGSGKRRLTERGGIHPRFSPDGKTIAFISYRDSRSNGDIYTVDIETETETLVVENPSIKLYPGYKAGSNEIIYTSIDADTNLDGRIDLKDNGVLVYKNIYDGTEYRLTHSSKSSFNSRWIPVFTSQAVNGIVLYSDQSGDSINISMIPDTGVIPRKQKVLQQYYLAENFLNEYNDTESYLMALEMVHIFFAQSSELSARVYSVKSLFEAALYYYKNHDRLNFKRIYKKIDEFARAETDRFSEVKTDKKPSGKKPVKLEKKDKDLDSDISGQAEAGRDFAIVLREYLRALDSGRKGYDIFTKYIVRFKADKDRDALVPFLYEALAAEYLKDNMPDRAAESYGKILAEYKNYTRINSINLRYSQLTDTGLGDDFSPAAIAVFKSGSSYGKTNLKKNFRKILRTEKPEARLAFIAKLESKYREDKEIYPFLNFLKGEAYYRSGDLKSAKDFLGQAVNSAQKSDIVSYWGNVLLGDIFMREKYNIAAEKYYHSAISGYAVLWREPDFRVKLKLLIDQYEERGQRAEETGNFEEAVSIYEKYSRLMSHVHRLNKFEDVYNQYGPRSQVLYIDSYLTLYGDTSIAKLEEDYQKSIMASRMEFDKAMIFGLAYIQTRLAMILENREEGLVTGQASGISGMLENLKRAIEQIDRALFIDENFIDPYILKSWIYQYLDLKRSEDDGKNDKRISRFFQSHLLEKNIDILEQALSIAEKNSDTRNAGNVHVNLANNYFLLMNYPRALNNYRGSQKYKKSYESKIEEALFYYHLAYCYWQTGDNVRAKNELKNVIYIYESLSGGNILKYRRQAYLLTKYFALFSRMEKKYSDAIAWYEKLLAMVDPARVKFDRARYIQELAFCYKELGNTTRAMAYLDEADALLAKYPDEEEKYYLKIKLMGLGPFSLYDLGQDTVVIGDNKIVSALSTRDKKLYGLSLREEIHISLGDYPKAAEALIRKIDLLKKKKTRTSELSMSVSLNNLGYYYYKMRNYSEAIRRMNEAWDYASTPKINDLDGAFTSVMNLSNLYVLLLETGQIDKNRADSEIKSLITRISEYRKNYEDNKFKQEFKELKKTADASKRKVEQNEIEELKEEISEDADKAYYRIDIALGVLYFYMAELNSENEISVSSRDEADAYRIYKTGTGLYSVYSEALERFEKGLEPAELRESKRLYIKLLLNSAKAYSRIGMYSKSHELYTDAKDISEKYEYQYLTFSSYAALADFLLTYGMELDGRDSSVEISEYYSKALSLAEAFPMNFLDSHKKVEALYDRYIFHLISRGEAGSAFFVSERKYEFTRVILIHQSAPAFADESDRASYSDYVAKSKELNHLQNRVSKLLEDGKQHDSKEIIILKEKMQPLLLSLSSKQSQADQKQAWFDSFIKINKPNINDFSNIKILKFYINAGYVGLWEATGGRVKFVNIGDMKSEFIREEISSALEGYESGAVVIADSSLYAVADIYPEISQYRFVPSASRAGFFISDAHVSLKRIYATEKGIKDRVKDTGIRVDEGRGWDIDFSKYTAVADISAEDKLKPARLFSRKAGEGTLLIKNIDFNDYEKTILFFESALYSGFRSIILTNHRGAEEYAKLITSLNSGDDSDETVSVKNNAKILRTGTFKIDQIEYDEYADTASMEFEELYESALYDFGIERFEAADKKIESMLKLDVADEAHDKAKILKIYSSLCMGSLGEASELLEKEYGTLAGYRDFHIFYEIILLASGNSEDSFERFAESQNLESVMSPGHLTLLYASYLHLAGFEDRALALTAKIPNKKYSDMDSMRASALTNTLKIADEKLFEEKLRDSSWLFKALLLKYRISALTSQERFEDAEKFSAMMLKASGGLNFPEFFRGLYYNASSIYSRLGKTDRAYDFALKGIEYTEQLSEQNKKYQLLLIDYEILLNKLSLAAGRSAELFKVEDLSEEERVLLNLYNAKIFLLNISKEKAVRADMAEQMEIFFSDSMEYFRRAPARSASFKKSHLALEVLNLYIQYRIRNGDFREALACAEFKRTFQARSMIKALPSASGIDNPPIDGDSETQPGFYNNPAQSLSRFNLDVPIKEIQAKLDMDTVIFYAIKNGSDIYVWTISNDLMKFIRIDSGFEKLKPVIESYANKVVEFKNIYSESRALDEIFEPLKEFYRGKKTIIFITDSEMESVQFELIGSKSYLDESHDILYLSSLSAALRPVSQPDKTVSLIGARCNELPCTVERTALLETKLKQTKTERCDTGNCHILSKVEYDRNNKKLIIGGKEYLGIIKNASYVYSASRHNETGNSNFAAYMASAGAYGVVINNAAMQDLNNAYFVETYYRYIYSGRSIKEAFTRAKLRLKARKEFSHPAYWAGIRLYLNGL